MKFKFDYKEKTGKLKQTVITSWRLLVLLWSIDKWLLIANAVAVTIPALVPFAFAYIFKLVIDQVVLSISTGNVDFYRFALIFTAGFVVYVIQSLSFSTQDYFHRLLYTKVPISLYQKVLSKISSLDVAYFEDSEFKNTLEKVKDAYTWRPLNMMEDLLFAFQSLIQVIAGVIILTTLAPLLCRKVFIHPLYLKC